MRVWLIASVLFVTAAPALAEWHCSIERSFTCDSAGKCASDGTSPRMILNDEKLTYRRCMEQCEEGAVSLRRDFFGTTYVHVAQDRSAITMRRSRSGEYSDYASAPDKSVTRLAYGSCSWRP